MRLRDLNQQMDQIRGCLAGLGVTEAEALNHGEAALGRLPDDQALANIAGRWRGYQHWCAPLRNRLWVETSEGQPIAAVTCTPEELVHGELERRRQALAQAPEDIQVLLQAVAVLEQRCAFLSEALLNSLATEEHESARSSTPLKVVA